MEQWNMPVRVQLKMSVFDLLFLHTNARRKISSGFRRKQYEYRIPYPTLQNWPSSQLKAFVFAWFEVADHESHLNFLFYETVREKWWGEISLPFSTYIIYFDPSHRSWDNCYLVKSRLGRTGENFTAISRERLHRIKNEGDFRDQRPRRSGKKHSLSSEEKPL